MEKRLLNINELAEYINIKVKTVYDLVYRKRIPYTKIGRCLRFDIGLIDEWIKLKTNIPFGLKICYNNRLVEGEGD